jgi:hypothetical protein
MQYLLMIYDEEKAWAKLPADVRAKLSQDYAELTRDIVKSGHFRAGAQLQKVSTATTVREQGGKRLTTDGPFAETKEQLGGYYLVECKDLDEALAIAQRIPSVRVGGAVEVRPLVLTSPGANLPPAR